MSEVHIEIDDRRSRPPSPFAAGAVEDLLAIAQQGAMVSNLAFANQVRNTDLAGQTQLARQQGMSRLRLAILAKAASQVQVASAKEARAAVEAFSGNETAQALADLRAVLAGSR
ncbi:hypothetical protein [Roseateles sp.]|uniref:hypothetical protein n=1 Tax=Roseateles sp. TaxID=1971397 RepID=UPI0032676E99